VNKSFVVSIACTAPICDARIVAIVSRFCSVATTITKDLGRPPRRRRHKTE